MWSACECVKTTASIRSENAAEIFHGGGAGVNGQRTAELIAKAPAIIEAHNVVGMRMRENDGINPIGKRGGDLPWWWGWRKWAADRRVDRKSAGNHRGP